MVLNSLLVQHIVGSLAAAGCFTVILTYLTFRDLRSLRYIELVFYVSLNDMIASIGLALGGSRSGSFVCTFQAIVTNMNYLSAIFWTTVIAYQLWLAVHYNHTIQQGKMFVIHLICWGLPLIVTLLPLTTNEFGNADDESTWCFIADRFVFALLDFLVYLLCIELILQAGVFCSGTSSRSMCGSGWLSSLTFFSSSVPGGRSALCPRVRRCKHRP